MNCNDRDVTSQAIANCITGAIGPSRLFTPGQIYSNLLWFFLVGPAAVITTYLLGRRWQYVNYISWPVAFGAMSLVPPATGISFSSWWIVNLIFNGLVRRRKPAWWSKYSMLSFSITYSLLEGCNADYLQITFYLPLWTVALRLLLS